MNDDDPHSGCDAVDSTDNSNEQRRYIFGPISSRRLGRSLGVNTIPLKTCNFSCTYCQLGETDHWIDERHDFFPPEDIVAEISEAIQVHREEVDFLTFAGEGEPTLCLSLGRLIRQAKRLSHIPVAVITNGSLLWREDVRNDLYPADLVMPSLDAANPDVFRRLNRPGRDVPIELIIKGVQDFGASFEGRYWIEVMLVDGVNDGDEELKELAGVLATAQPDRIVLNLPTRPPADGAVHLPGADRLRYARELFEPIAEVDYPMPMESQLQTELTQDDLLQALRSHPLRVDQLEMINEDVEALIHRLEQDGRVERITRDGVSHLIIPRNSTPERNR
jgi:wyosine [tRNA(Phe)-imidazoG37] synthetase (radical SAM superfamily)